MNHARIGALGVAAASLTLMSTPVGASAGSLTKTYYGGVSEFQEDYANAAVGQPAPPTICQQNPGVGEACFTLPAGVTTVHIKIKDQNTAKIPARVWYYDDKYLRTDSQRGDVICSEGDVEIPDGTTHLDIKLGPIGRQASTLPPPAAVPAMACGAPEPVTTGTVTITGDGIGTEAQPAPRQVGTSEPGGERLGMTAVRAIATAYHATAAPAAVKEREL